MNEVIKKRIERDIFRIMKKKLKGNKLDVELRCWQMVKVAESIHRRFGVLPYSFKLKHILWYLDNELFWITSIHTEYRYYLAIKSFCQCLDKWGHWQNLICTRSPQKRSQPIS